MVDVATQNTIASIPLLKTKARPRDGNDWPVRLKEEYRSLIKVYEQQQSARKRLVPSGVESRGDTLVGKVLAHSQSSQGYNTGRILPNEGPQKSRDKWEIFSY